MKFIVLVSAAVTGIALAGSAVADNSATGQRVTANGSQQPTEMVVADRGKPRSSQGCTQEQHNGRAVCHFSKW